MNVLNCGCNGGPVYGATYGGVVQPTLSTLSAIAGPGPGYVAATAPAVQIQSFEPARWMPEPVFAVMPYSPALVSAVTPVYPAGAPALAAASAATLASTAPSLASYGLAAQQPQASLAAAATAAALRPPEGFRVTPCGPCAGAVTSPLPPNGVAAWEELLRQVNAPYQAFYRYAL